MDRSRPSRAIAAALLAVLLAGASGCGGDATETPSAQPTSGASPGSAAPSSEPDSAAPSAASTTPPADRATSAAPTGVTTSAPATPPQQASGGRTVVEQGVSVQVPAGWQVTTLTPEARAQALAREQDPRVAEFLRGRLDGLAQQGAVLYLYDLRTVQTGTLSTAEVYRYPVGRTPQEVLDRVLLPRFEQAGLMAVPGQTVLPAGTALTTTAQTQTGGQPVRNQVFVLPLGRTAVGLSVTTVGPVRADAAQLAQGLAAA